MRSITQQGNQVIIKQSRPFALLLAVLIGVLFLVQSVPDLSTTTAIDFFTQPRFDQAHVGIYIVLVFVLYYGISFFTKRVIIIKENGKFSLQRVVIFPRKPIIVTSNALYRQQNISLMIKGSTLFLGDVDKEAITPTYRYRRRGYPRSEFTFTEQETNNLARFLNLEVKEVDSVTAVVANAIKQAMESAPEKPKD